MDMEGINLRRREADGIKAILGLWRLVPWSLVFGVFGGSFIYDVAMDGEILFSQVIGSTQRAHIIR